MLQTVQSLPSRELPRTRLATLVAGLAGSHRLARGPATRDSGQNLRSTTRDPARHDPRYTPGPRPGPWPHLGLTRYPGCSTVPPNRYYPLCPG